MTPAPSGLRQKEVVGDAQASEEAGSLIGTGNSKAGPVPRSQHRAVDSIDLNQARGWAHVTRDQIEQRGFPRAVGAQETEALAVDDIEIDAIHGHKASECLRQRTDPEG
jgi:hypothetical protein